MKAVLFDLFETLITEWGKPKLTTRQMAEALQIDYSAFRGEWEAVHAERYRGRLSGTVQVIERILNCLKISRNESLIAAIAGQRDATKKACFDNIDPDILDMLSIVKGKGLKIGLISNCSDEEIHGLWKCALFPFFDSVILSSDTGFIKPEPEIYRLCLSQIGEDPVDCLYAGDGGSNELWGASQLGCTPCKAVWFTKHFMKGFDADKTFPILYEPNQLLKFIGGQNA